MGGGRTVGIWEQSVCLVHPDVPTASTGEPQTHLHAQGDTRRLHCPLQPGVWGSTTISPEFTFEAKHKCLGGQKQPRALCPGSTAVFPPSGPPCASPGIQHLLQKHGTHVWIPALWRVTWPCFRLAWNPFPGASADSVLERILLSGISSSSSLLVLLPEAP